jgi:hypothetical protein
VPRDDRGELGLLIDARLGGGVAPRAVADAADHERPLGDELGRRGRERRHQARDHTGPHETDAAGAHALEMRDRAHPGK